MGRHEPSAAKKMRKIRRDGTRLIQKTGHEVADLFPETTLVHPAPATPPRFPGAATRGRTRGRRAAVQVEHSATVEHPEVARLPGRLLGQVLAERVADAAEVVVAPAVVAADLRRRGGG